MDQYFLNDLHRERFQTLAKKDSMKNDDIERISLFYLIAGNDNLYCERDKVYNWRSHGIRLCLDEDTHCFSSGMASMIRLGFNLYNGYWDEYTNPKALLSNLDRTNQLLAHKAISIRFGI